MIIWFFVGAISALLRRIEFDWFDYLSWGQIITFSIIIGPAWIIVGALWGIYLFFKKIEELWDLLGEIGKR